MTHSYEPQNHSEFWAEMADVKPLSGSDSVVLKPQQNSLAATLKRQALESESRHTFHGLSLELTDYLDPYDLLSYKQNGIQEGVFKNLRTGKYPIEQRISLQKLALEEARRVLIDAFEKSFAQGVRVVLIQHGIGLNSQPKPAKMKSYVNAWLPNLPMVIAFHSAQKQHGGSGSTYVLLKKNSEQKLINREKHQRRFY
ncbi:MAG: DNA endonuclease SmrA [Glaciecola sp.]|jgi:DNA-nicking Smr family endonuclease